MSKRSPCEGRRTAIRSPLYVCLVQLRLVPRSRPADPEVIEATWPTLGCAGRTSSGSGPSSRARGFPTWWRSLAGCGGTTTSTWWSRGGGAVRAAVRAPARALGGHARELGFVATADLVALYGGAAAFVFPSAYEGFGLFLLEAMGCGAFAVGFPNSSLPEVAGDAAVLVPDGDGAALLAALEHLLSDPGEAARRRRLGRSTRRGSPGRRPPGPRSPSTRRSWAPSSSISRAEGGGLAPSSVNEEAGRRIIGCTGCGAGGLRSRPWATNRNPAGQAQSPPASQTGQQTGTPFGASRRRDATELVRPDEVPARGPSDTRADGRERRQRRGQMPRMGSGGQGGGAAAPGASRRRASPPPVDARHPGMPAR